MTFTVHEDIGLGECKCMIEDAMQEQGVQSRYSREQYQVHACVLGLGRFLATYAKIIRQ